MENIDPGSIFKIQNPDTGKTVMAVTCTAAAETLPVHARTLKNAVAAKVLPGGQTVGRWWVEVSAVKRVQRLGWRQATGIVMGPRKKRKKRPTAPRHLIVMGPRKKR